MSYRDFETTRVTASAAIALSAAVPTASRRRLVSVTVHFAVAPSSAGSLTITLNDAAGAAYDTILVSANMIGVTDYFYAPTTVDILLNAGDSIDVAYANPDGRTYGAQVKLEII